MIRNRTLRNRRGFSLIELLTVISILALLSAIFVGVLVTVRGDSNTRTTNETLNKIQAAIDQQVKIAVDTAKRERKDRADTFTRLIPYCNNDEDRAEALLVLVKVRLQFPVTFAEARSQLAFPTVPTAYPRPAVFNSIPATTPADMTANDRQAAALLYLSLSGFSQTDGVQTDQIAQGNIGDFKVFRDAWGTHINLVRFGQNAELEQPTYSQPGPNGNRDPFDPRNKLTAAWPNQGGAANALGIRFNGQNRVVTAYSAGANKAFDTITNALASDDVWGYRVRKQGTKTD